MPRLDLAKAVSNASNANQIKQNNSNVKPETKKTDEGVKNAKVETKPSLPAEQKSEPPEKKPTQEMNLNVSPDIFVSLKKGLISDYYKIGKTLGEGIKLFLFEIHTTRLLKAYLI